MTGSSGETSQRLAAGVVPFIESAGIDEHDGEIVVGAGMQRVQFDGATGGGDALVDATHAAEDHGAELQRAGVGRIQLERCAVVLVGASRVPLLTCAVPAARPIRTGGEVGRIGWYWWGWVTYYVWTGMQLLVNGNFPTLVLRTERRGADEWIVRQVLHTSGDLAYETAWRYVK